MDKSDSIKQFIEELFQGSHIFTSINADHGLIIIKEYDHRFIQYAWQLMPKLDDELAELTQGDITDIKVHLHCNQYEPNGAEFFTFTINFQIG
jgi:hypothetical protein